MKKIIKCAAILLAVIGLAGCTRPTDGRTSNPWDITVNGVTVELGSVQGWHSTVSGNTITWLKDYDDCATGWNLTDIDLSEYKKVRIEFESYEGKLFITLCNNEWNITHNFITFTEENVLEANLTGEGSYYADPQQPNLIDTSKGLKLMLQSYIVGEERPADQKVVVKSIELIK
ncbi:MAG: hypothetical protein K5829_09025 [Treponema sp.]|nr:hypothetical protein [Treponema sp.]